MEEFDYKMEHRTGERLKHADALSRKNVVELDEEAELYEEEEA